VNEDVVVVLIVILTLLAWVAILVGGVKVAKKKNRSPHWMWFGIHPLSGLVALVVLLLVKPLSRCPRCGGRLPAQAAVCPTCEHDLAQPAGAALDLPAPGEPFWATGKFRKVRFKSLGAYGQFRGEGQLSVGEEGLTIVGRHVKPLGSRWAMALGIFFLSLVLSFAASGGTAWLAPGLIPLYLFVEYVWLEREERKVSWSDVTRFTTDPAQELLAIEFQGPRWTSPVVLRTGRWREVAGWLRQRVPGGEVPAAASGATRSAVWTVVVIVLVVIMVIGIIAAIAIPNLLEARRRAEQREAAPAPVELVP
jgi:hypothetical protein